MTRSFLDTNVLVYAFDLAEPAKRTRALNVLAEHPDAVISTQVMLEWVNVVTRKIARPLQMAQAREHLAKLARFEVVSTDADLVQGAVELMHLRQLSIWDAMIVAAARRARCEVIFTEDLTDGAVLGGVRIVNPFTDNPDADA